MDVAERERIEARIAELEAELADLPPVEMEALVVDCRFPELFQHATEFARANGTDSKSFHAAITAAYYDESKHTRWPKGTPVNELGHGGGRFAPHAETADYPTAPMVISQENLDDAIRRLAREERKLERITDPALLAKQQKEVTYWRNKIDRLRKGLGLPSGGTPDITPPAPAPAPASEFQTRFQQAVEADRAALEQLTQTAVDAKTTELLQARLGRHQKTVERLVNDGHAVGRYGVVKVGVPYYSETRDQNEARAAEIETQLNRLSFDDLTNILLDPDSADPLELAYAKQIEKMWLNPGIDGRSTPNETYVEQDPNDSKLTVTVSASGTQDETLAQMKQRAGWRAGAELVTAEQEQAVIRVGNVIRDEVAARANTLRTAEQARVLAVKNQIADEIEGFMVPRGLVWDRDAFLNDSSNSPTENAYTWHMWSDDGRMSPIVGHNLERIKEDDPAAYGRIKALIETNGLQNRVAKVGPGFNPSRDAARQVLAEVREMGGTFKNTPANRKVRRGRNTHEIVTAAAPNFPADWIAASNAYGGGGRFRLTSGRAHYRHSDGEITLDQTDWVASHEITHRMEYTVPTVYGLEREFYDRRTVNSPAQDLQKIYPRHGYGRDERSKPDEFFTAYAGKKYSDAYEILTSGSEAVFGGRRMQVPSASASPVEIDPEYEAFVLGTWALAYRKDLP